MKKILLSGVDGNFGERAAKVLLERYPHEDLIFTAPTEKGLSGFREMGIETRIADYNSDQLSDTFAGADTMILISMPFVGPRRRSAQKRALDAAVKAGIKFTTEYQKTDVYIVSVPMFIGLLYLTIDHDSAIKPQQNDNDLKLISTKELHFDGLCHNSYK